MIKLVTIVALVAATLGTGCKKKERTERDSMGTAPKTTESMKREEKSPEAMALPAECNEYRATIERIRTCEALPQPTRDALAQAYQQASSGWATATPEARESLAASCRSANDAIRQSASACP
ncbi:MAG: hypothetical protein SFX73_22420 [Kofleriaceae bacterium]|nr:hypothetical protein [Kofleriaceae bacterium]